MTLFAPTLFGQCMAMMAESCCSWRTYDRIRSNIDVPLPYCGDGGGVHSGVVALLRSDSYDPMVLLRAESYDQIRFKVDASPAKL